MKIFLPILILFTVFPLINFPEAAGTMRVHFIDVGQGDSILIETPENQVILIDGGVPQAGETVIRYLKKHNIEKIHLLIATHPDFDHIGGLNKLFNHIPVERMIDNGKVHYTKTYALYRFLTFKKRIPIETAAENQTINLEESIEIQVLNAANNSKNMNPSSIVLMVSYEEIDFLLMSDVETEQEERMAENYEVEAEFLKVAHHGSDTSSSSFFLKEVQPEAAIISYSESNEYGHPASEVIKNLERLKTQIYFTAVHGDIIVETDGENYIIMPEMHPMEKIRMGL